jgi:VWFA-related protein
LNIESEKRHQLFSLLVLLLVLLLFLFIAANTVAQDARPRRVVPGDQSNATKTPPAEPENPEVLKIDSNLVNVPVIVSDREGRYVPNLPVTSFKLFDNGSEQKIAHFEAAEEPLNIALLLDTSRSTAGVLDEIKKAARDFLKQLRPQDRALVVSFDYAIHRLIELTNNRKRLEKAIDDAKAGEFVGTMLNDAIQEVVNKDFKSITGRKAIVLLSDGEDFGSETPVDILLNEQSESDAMVYSIYYKPARLRESAGLRIPGRRLGAIFGRPAPRSAARRNRVGPRGAEFLEELSEATSGRFYSSELTDLRATFSMIAEELRHHYKLGFYPSDIKEDATLHQLRVKVEVDGVAVRARKQYRAEK